MNVTPEKAVVIPLGYVIGLQTGPKKAYGIMARFMIKSEQTLPNFQYIKDHPQVSDRGSFIGQGQSPPNLME